MPLSETASRPEHRIRDAVSARGRSGKAIPLWSYNLGRAFRQRPQGESASHSEHHIRALGYLRSHISANEISLTSPLLSAASRHPCVKPLFEKSA